MHNGEDIGPAFGDAALATPAYLIETDAEQGCDQRKARDQREDQRDQAMVEGEPADDKTGNRVDEAEEDDVRAAGLEVAGAVTQRRAQVGEPDATHDGRRR